MVENIETVARFGYCSELNKPEFMATHCLAHPSIVCPTKEFLKITYPEEIFFVFNKSFFKVLDSKLSEEYELPYHRLYSEFLTAILYNYSEKL